MSEWEKLTDTLNILNNIFCFKWPKCVIRLKTRQFWTLCWRYYSHMHIKMHSDGTHHRNGSGKGAVVELCPEEIYDEWGQREKQSAQGKTQAKEVTMNSFKAILQMSYDSMGNDSIIIHQRPADRSEVSDPDFTSFWWVFGFCTVLRLKDMTTSGGGDRSLTTEIRSIFCATASTLDQLIGWLLNSRGHSESGHS